MVLRMFLQLCLDFRNPSSRFLRINFSNILATLDFVKEVFIESFHCASRALKAFTKATLPGVAVWDSVSRSYLLPDGGVHFEDNPAQSEMRGKY